MTIKRNRPKPLSLEASLQMKKRFSRKRKHKKNADAQMLKSKGIQAPALSGKIRATAKHGLNKSEIYFKPDTDRRLIRKTCQHVFGNLQVDFKIMK